MKIINNFSQQNNAGRLPILICRSITDDDWIGAYVDFRFCPREDPINQYRDAESALITEAAADAPPS